MFGAAFVEGRDGRVLVLKASTDLQLAPEWAMGAAASARLRELGYPASHYLETGTADTVIWSLQEVLPGSVPLIFTVGHAAQLLALVHRHDTDSGMRRPWDALARDISRRALADLGPLPDRFDETLRSVLDRTEDVVLAQTTIVHGDFHHRNILVDDDRVVGVFDWDIVGPGDWRFDLVTLAFACQMYPKTCETNAVAAIVAAVREYCDAPTVAFLMACQTLRALSMLRSHRPDRLGQGSTRMQATLADWWI